MEKHTYQHGSILVLIILPRLCLHWHKSGILKIIIKEPPFSLVGMGQGTRKHILEHVGPLSPSFFLALGKFGECFPRHSPAISSFYHCAGWIWTGGLFAMDTHAPQEPENLYRTWLGIASGETEQQKKRQAKHKRDLNGFGDPSFPLHLKTWQRRKCAIWTFSGWIWSCGHILSPGMLPWSGSPNRCVRRVRRSNPKRKPKWNPTSLMHRLRQVHHQTVTCVFLLLLITLSISFLVCWFSSLSGFLSVEIYSGTLCDEHRTQHIYFKNIVPTRAFLGGVLASVLSPPQTCNLNIFFGREWRIFAKWCHVRCRQEYSEVSR